MSDHTAPEQSSRQQLMSDVLALARATGDRVLTRPHLVALLSLDALEQVRAALLSLYVCDLGDAL